jgi:hypothetical protein
MSVIDEENGYIPAISIGVDRAPSEIEQQVCAVSVNSPIDELIAAIDAADFLLARAKSIRQVIEQLAISWIDHHGEFSVGDITYSVSYATTTRCRQVRECGQTLMRQLGGDFGAFLQLLCSQPFKHGSCKRVVDKRTFASLFEVRHSGRLVNGIPARVLRRSNTRFLPVSADRVAPITGRVFHQIQATGAYRQEK